MRWNCRLSKMAARARQDGEAASLRLAQQIQEQEERVWLSIGNIPAA